jgi:hypothetical protein
MCIALPAIAAKIGGKGYNQTEHLMQKLQGAREHR